MINSPSVVKDLLEKCLEIQLNKVKTAKRAMDEAQNSANEEEKSTAGDKYDTARAMSQNVRDMNARQLQEAIKELAILQQIKPGIQKESVKVGNIVKTSSGNYFISISAGKIVLNGENYFAISPLSPLGQEMLNKKKGDAFKFRGNSILIKEIL